MLGCKTLKPEKECWVATSLTKTDGSLMLLRTEDSKNVVDCKYSVLQHLRFETTKEVIGKRGFFVSFVGKRHEKSHEQANKKSQLTKSTKTPKVTSKQKSHN